LGLFVKQKESLVDKPMPDATPEERQARAGARPPRTPRNDGRT